MSEIRFALIVLFGLSSVLLLNAAPHPAPQQNANVIDQFSPGNFPFANRFPFLQGNRNNGTSSTNGTSTGGSSGIPFIPDFNNMGNIPFGNMVAGTGNTNIPFGDLFGGNSQWQNLFGGFGTLGSGSGTPPKKD